MDYILQTYKKMNKKEEWICIFYFIIDKRLVHDGIRAHRVTNQIQCVKSWGNY